MVHGQLLALTLLPIALVLFGARGASLNGPMKLWLAALALLAMHALSGPAGLSQGCILLVALAAGWQAYTQGGRLSQGLWAGLLLAALLNALIAMAQLLAPQWMLENAPVASLMPGRAVGHLLQPNLLATLLLIGVVGLAVFAAKLRWPWQISWAALMLLMAGLVASGSRGAWLVGVPIILLWGLLDKRLPAHSRRLLMGAPLIGLAAYLLLNAWPQSSGVALGDRLAEQGAGLGTRSTSWAQTLELIRDHPLGVGAGEFMRAWVMTPFSARPELIDHSHNLPLQLLVEHGWFLGGAAVLLLAASLLLTARSAWHCEDESSLGRRAAVVALVIVAAHSMTEFPLWFAHVLLPVALLWGGAMAPNGSSERPAKRWTLAWAPLVAAGALWAAYEYAGLAALHRSGQEPTVQRQRVLDAQRSVFFAPQGAYALAMMLQDSPKLVSQLSAQAAQTFVDPKLLLRWARAEYQLGELERAKYLVARIAEFSWSREAATVAALCEQQPSEWACDKKPSTLTWQDFRH